MTPEITTEWYQFTCPRCHATWTGRYQVRHVTDEAGQTRSFYTLNGLPCESPARAQAACPACGHAPVQAELLTTPPVGQLPPQPEPANNEDQVRLHRYGPLEAWRRFTFKAIISLDDGGGWQPRQPAVLTRSLMVRVPDPDSVGRILPAVITREDEQPLRPGDSHVVVTISVPGGEEAALFSPGSHFELWAGTNVGHGTVYRRVFA